VSDSSERFELIRFPDEQSLADSVAERWLADLGRSSSSVYCVALAGGRITRRFLASIARICRERSMSLDRVHFFWGDERCVPPSDPESNFGVARDELFSPLAIDPNRIHRIRGEIDAAQAVSEAEAEICRIAPMNGEKQPILDMIFLGMGEDGHVASLFPGESEAAVKSESIYRSVVATKPPPVRITLGYAAIAAAREVWVLASGRGKEQALSASLREEGDSPLARVVKLRQRTALCTDIQF
jgi:6-phosphogluconolactonase